MGKQHDEHNNLNHHDADKHREYEDNDGFQAHNGNKKRGLMGILLPLIALLLILAALAIFIGMYLNNDHKDKNNNTADNKTEQTENKDNAKDKDNATNEKDQ